ncbi:hypothetical protein AVEN_55902-1 [Araneus ventricosus]|uniref:Uncharacterized protein n=1 Tax=Araneus ventricosus TaxID=182803 RepID=A0A4Y2IAZ7_ARAVE|nr:hypothetical protein AVEN_55902-1 [Araneus ventricosus]
MGQENVGGHLLQPDQPLLIPPFHTSLKLLRLPAKFIYSMDQDVTPG